MEPSSSTLPVDLVREVLKRCDHETVIRCAASSKFLCRCMDDPAFLRQFADAPSVLIGFFTDTPTRFVEFSAPAIIPRNLISSVLSNNAADLPESSDWKPVTSCGGLVVLKRGRSRWGTPVELCVCEPMTGRRSRPLPPTEIDVHTVVLLDAGTATGSSFQLLAVYLPMYTGHTKSQLFSSAEPFPAGSATIMPGAWGPVATVALPADEEIYYTLPDYSPVVINRVVHWLCRTDMPYGVLALDVDKGSTRLFQAPWGYQYIENVVLASTADKKLSLIMLQKLVISVLVLTGDGRPWTRSWTRRLVIRRDGLPSQLQRLNWFGERSGTVVAEKTGGGCLVLNLDGKEPARSVGTLARPCCLYEMDLASLLLAKKSL